MNDMRKSLWMISLAVLCTINFHIVGQRQIEQLTRGVVAIRTSSSDVLISWRWLATDEEHVSFNVYRDGVKLNTDPIAGRTNLVDNTSSNNGVYTVKAVVGGTEVDAGESVSVMANTYFDVPLQIPTGGITPAGEAYTYSANDASVGDVDGDGVYEIILKWDPSNAKDNSQSGYTGNVFIDCYKLDGTRLWRVDLGRNIRAGAHYTQFMVYDFDGDGRSEMACKTAPNTKDGKGNYLSMGPAVNDNDAADYRNSGGYILTGPEYLTVFNGLTGAEMATVNYNPPRGTVSDWGDSYGNRVDRFLACVAYLDGEHPSLVMCRGYYTRATLAAWDWRNGSLTQRWFFDSNASGNSYYAGQGNHNLSVADVDGDGKDEIVYGSCTIDHDGKGLYSTRLGHGDALHLTDHAPDVPGLEVFAPHEESGRGISFRDSRTGAIIWQKKAPGDIGRGAAADITSAHRGSEFWAAGMGMYNVKGEQISTSTPSINHLVWWDGDLLRELLDGISITKYGAGTLLNASGCASNNGTKANPSLQVDLWGDWREEVIWRTSDNSKLRIYSTPYASEYRVRTLMHDPVYRLGVAWQNVAYNQPPHVGFYLGDGMRRPSLQPVVQAELKWNGVSGNVWDLSEANWFNESGVSVAFANDASVVFSLSGNNSKPVVLTGDLAPRSVNVASPSDYAFGGDGKLTGGMSFVKTQHGKLTINGTHDFTGKTYVSDGEMQVDGQLTQTSVYVFASGELSGTGTLGKDVTVYDGGCFYVGHKQAYGSSLVAGNLILAGDGLVQFDISSSTSESNDQLNVSGDLVITGSNNQVFVNMLSGSLSSGTYVLANVSGNLQGDLNGLLMKGLNTVNYSIRFSDGQLLLDVQLPRASASVVWSGNVNGKMDMLDTYNWINNGEADVLAPNDNVLFDDSGVLTVEVVEEVLVSEVTVNATSNYVFTGNGAIAGNASLRKENSGTLKLNANNTYSGATLVNGGILDVPFLNYAGLPSPIGAAGSSADNLLLNGGKIRYSGGKANTNRGMSVGVNGGELEITQAGTSLMLEGAITGGDLIKSGLGTLVLDGAGKTNTSLIITSGAVTLNSDDAAPSKKVVFHGGTLNSCDNYNSYNTMSWAIEVPAGKSGTINLDSRGYYTGALTGAGVFNVRIPNNRSDINGDWSAFSGTINFVNTSSGTGELRIGNANGMPSANVNIGGSLNAFHLNSLTTKFGALVGSGNLSGSHNWEIGAKNTSFTFDGTISAGSLNKVGSGRMTLTKSNTYSGGTTITSGVLIASNTTGSATGNGGVIVKDGAALSGTGTITGAVTVQSGGSLLPGFLTTIGTLNINNGVTFQQGALFHVDLDASTSASDVLNLPTKTLLLQNATLQVFRRGGVYAAGNTFKIINASAITGTFDAISPAVPAEGLFWDTSELYTSGILKITDIATAVKPLSVLAGATVYPNPVRDRLTVTLPEGLLSAAIQIVDLTGRQIDAVDASGQVSVEVDTGSWKKGVYLVKIVSGSDVLVKKVTKE